MISVLAVTGLNSFTTGRTLSEINETSEYVSSAFQQTVATTEAQRYSARAQFTAAVLAQQCQKKDAECAFIAAVAQTAIADAQAADDYISLLRQTLNEHKIMVPEPPKAEPTEGFFCPKIDKEA